MLKKQGVDLAFLYLCDIFFVHLNVVSNQTISQIMSAHSIPQQGFTLRGNEFEISFSQIYRWNALKIHTHEGRQEQLPAYTWKGVLTVAYMTGRPMIQCKFATDSFFVRYGGHLFPKEIFMLTIKDGDLHQPTGYSEEDEKAFVDIFGALLTVEYTYAPESADDVRIKPHSYDKGMFRLDRVFPTIHPLIWTD